MSGVGVGVSPNLQGGVMIGGSGATIPEPPAGQSLMIDEDGMFVVDENGSFIYAPT